MNTSSASSSTTIPSASYDGRLVLHNYQQRFSSSKPLSQYQLQQIFSNANFFKEDSHSHMSLVEFDKYSFSFIKNLLQSDELHDCSEFLGAIFNKRLSDKQVSRHLGNLLTFLYLFGCNDVFKLPIDLYGTQINRVKIIAAQISFLSTSTLMNAAKWAEGEHDNSFLPHLWSFLELEEERMDALECRPRNSGRFDSFREVRNWMVSDAILSQETPNSIFEAQSVNESILMKYVQIPSTMAFAVALALSGAGPYALLCFALAPLVELAKKIYVASLDAPLCVEPLSDSRKLDLASSKFFFGRDDIIKEIEAIWKEKKHPLLVGVPGVGKTTIMEAISRKIASGAIPEFSGKVVFMGSAAELTAPNTMGTPHFQRVVRAIQPYKDNVVLALDEFHALFQATDRTIITLARSILDGSQRSLPYCLFATTLEDYNEHIKKDESLGRRVKVIIVNPLRRDHMLNMLHMDAKDISPFLTISPEAMELIYEQAQGKQNESKLLLREVIKAADAVNTTHPCYDQRDLKKAEIEKYKSLRRDPNYSLIDLNLFSDQISKANQELEKIEAKCSDQEKMRSKFIEMKKYLIASSKELNLISKQIYGFVIQYVGKDAKETAKINALKDTNFANMYNDPLKRMVFLRYFELSNMVRFVRNYASIFDLINVVDADFIRKHQLLNLVSRPKIANTKMGKYLEEDKKDLSLDSVTPVHSKETFLPPVPIKGIQVGLKNFGNSCWLNATLKFIASTTYYDEMLGGDPPKGVERLHGFLKDMIFHLRTGEQVPETSYLAFMRELRKATQKFEKGQQHDAVEFLEILCEQLKWAPTVILDEEAMRLLNDSKKYPRTASEYVHAPRVGHESEDALPSGWGKKVFHENSRWVIEVNISLQSTALDISQQLEKPELVSVQLDRLTDIEPASDKVDNVSFPFEVIAHFTCLPDVVMIHLKRFHQDGNVERRIDAPIELEENEFITLNRYEIESKIIGGVSMQEMKLKERCRYRIGAAICHIGGSSTEHGHYVCEERPAESGNLIRHDDSKVHNDIKVDNFGRQGYLLRLNKVNKADPMEAKDFNT